MKGGIMPPFLVVFNRYLVQLWGSPHDSLPPGEYAFLFGCIFCANLHNFACQQGKLSSMIAPVFLS